MMQEILKQSTDTLHRSVEQRLAGVLFSPALTQLDYREILQGLYRAHRHLEQQIALFPTTAALLSARSKTALLRSDLQNLTITYGPAATSFTAPVLQPLRSQAEAWGALYVLEGSTLGGKVIASKLRRHTWLNDAHLQFFNCYGAKAAQKWQDFLLDLNHYGECYPAHRMDVVAGAIIAFTVIDLLTSESPAYA